MPPSRGINERMNKLARGGWPARGNSALVRSKEIIQFQAGEDIC